MSNDKIDPFLIQLLGILLRLRNFIFPSSKFPTHNKNKEYYKIASSISPELFGRTLVLVEFINNLQGHFSIHQPLQIAVIGGYEREPEILILRKLGYEINVTFFGITMRDNYLDLNSYPNSRISNVGCDLVLCSQVFEHIWNYKNAFENIKSIMHTNTLLWLAAPASNHPHGIPQYYSAGFTSDFLVLNLQDCGFVIQSSGNLGSPRNYLATHILPTWLSFNGHKYPLLKAFENFDRAHNVAYSIRYFMRTTLLCFVSPRVLSDVSYATESWALAKLDKTPSV